MAYSAPTAHCAVSSETLMLQVRFAHPPNPAPSSRLFVLFSKTHDLQVRFALPPNCAPKPSFRRFWCSAWLIQLRQRTALSPLKRSCFRFTSLTLRTPHRPPVSLCFSPKRTTFRFASLSLRLRAETFFQKVPVFRMAYLEQKPHRGFCSKTLMLQVRFAHPPNPAPSYRFFVLFSKTHDLQVRFARASAAFAASIEARRAVSSETLMLQPLRGLRTPHRPPVFSPLAAAAD